MNYSVVGSECMPAKSLQSCQTLCNPIDYRPPGPSVHGSLQARILKRVVIPFSRLLALNSMLIYQYINDINKLPLKKYKKQI